MDVFISEEYAIRRRMEKKAALSGNGNKSSKMVSDSGSSSNLENANKAQQSSSGIDQTKFLVSSGVSENTFNVFNYFSA